MSLQTETTANLFAEKSVTDTSLNVDLYTENNNNNNKVTISHENFVHRWNTSADIKAHLRDLPSFYFYVLQNTCKR